jgi:hypothetical protein
LVNWCIYSTHHIGTTTKQRQYESVFPLGRVLSCGLPLSFPRTDYSSFGWESSPYVKIYTARQMDSMGGWTYRTTRYKSTLKRDSTLSYVCPKRAPPPSAHTGMLYKSTPHIYTTTHLSYLSNDKTDHPFTRHNTTSRYQTSYIIRILLRDRPTDRPTAHSSIHYTPNPKRLYMQPYAERTADLQYRTSSWVLSLPRTTDNLIQESCSLVLALCFATHPDRLWDQCSAETRALFFAELASRVARTAILPSLGRNKQWKSHGPATGTSTGASTGASTRTGTKATLGPARRSTRRSTGRSTRHSTGRSIRRPARTIAGRRADYCLGATRAHWEMHWERC